MKSIARAIVFAAMYLSLTWREMGGHPLPKWEELLMGLVCGVLVLMAVFPEKKD